MEGDGAERDETKGRKRGRERIELELTTYQSRLCRTSESQPFHSSGYEPSSPSLQNLSVLGL